MFLYPVQRQMPPEMATRISWSVGSGFSSRSARVVISIPGVQNPHWSAWRSWKPIWIGSSCPSTSSDSTVRTSCPLHIAARVVHDFTGRPSTWTTQAPQLDVSQPQWVPVRPSVSRMKWTSSMRGSTSCETRVPLTVMVTSISRLLLHRTRDRSAERPLGEHAREVALVVDRPAAVGHGRAVLGGDLARLREQLLRRRLAAQQLLGPSEMDGRQAAGRERDAGVGDDPAPHPPGRGGGGDGPVAGPPLDLLVRAARAGAHRQAHLGQDLAGADRGHERPDVEALHADDALAVAAADHHVRPGGGAHRGQVLGRVGLAQRPADRAAVARDRAGGPLPRASPPAAWRRSTPRARPRPPRPGTATRRS